jgi:hypothetical protein
VNSRVYSYAGGHANLVWKETLLLQISKWLFLGAGVLCGFFSFAAWFLVPGRVDLNRFLVAGFCASLTTNALLLSGIFFSEGSERAFATAGSVFRTLPSVMLALFLFAFGCITVTAPLWTKH